MSADAALSVLPVAAAAIYAYLDARFNISYDLRLIRSFVTSRASVLRRVRADRLSIFYMLEGLAQEQPNRDFLVYQGAEYSYAHAYNLVLRHASWLKERHGVKRGDIVALDFMNCPSMVWLWFGLWALGASPAMINYNLTGDRLVHCVKAATSSLMLVDPEVASVLDDENTKAALAGFNVVVFDESMSMAVATWPATRPDDSHRDGIKVDDMSMLIFTSGTTGLPKAANVTYSKITYASGFVAKWMPLTRDDRFYTSMPLYHSSATILGMGSVLSAGCTMVLGHRFSASQTIPELRASRATVMQYVGETCRYLLASPPTPQDRDHNVRVAFGNGMRSDVWSAFKERFGIPTIAEFYASTEGVSASWHLQEGEWGVGAIGKNGVLTQLILGHKIAIVRMADDGSDMPIRDPNTGFCIRADYGEPGELLWRLDPADIGGQFKGYHNAEKATNEKVLRDVFTTGDMWFRSGDLQRRDATGLWYFVDRIGDTFRWKSENVSTTEVADVANAATGVKEAAVYGVAVPGHEGRCGCAAISLEPTSSVHAMLASLHKNIGALPRYARPIFVRIVDGIEHTGNNKQVKHVLRDQGVDPAKAGDDKIYWLTERGYEPFGNAEWERIVGGKAKL